MTAPINPNISNMQGELAIPRRNGEPVLMRRGKPAPLAWLWR
jgi:hypothetical protein